MAIADLDQKAKQENDNEVDAEGGLVIQGQLAGQINLNVQAAAAFATAESGDVDVWQSGVLHAGLGGVEGDGIEAESKAAAVASLEQKAKQENENSADADLVIPDETILIGESVQHRHYWPPFRYRVARRGWPAGTACWSAQPERAGWCGDRRR